MGDKIRTAPIGLRLLAYNLVILAVGEVLSRALTFIAFVHLARVLDPPVYGLVELTLALTMFLALLVDQGLGTLGAREVARRPFDAEPLVGRIVSGQLMLAVILFALLVLITSYLPIGPLLTKLLLGYGISLLGLPFLLNWVFQGRNQMIWVALPQVLRWVTFGTLVLLLIHRPDQLLLLPFAEISAVALAAIVSLIIFRRSGERVVLSLRRAFDRHLLAESLPIGGSQIIWALRMYLPTVLLGVLAGRETVGFFGAAQRIVMVFQTMLSVYVMNLFPSMSQAAHNSPAHLADLLRRSLKLVAWPSVAISLVTTIVAPSLVSFIYGKHYVRPETIGVLAVLIWNVPILAWRGHGRNALLSMGCQRAELWCSLTGLSLLIGVGVPVSYTHGGLGFACAMVTSELITTILIWWRVRYQLDRFSSVQ